MSVQIGQPAPDLELRDTQGTPVRLSALTENGPALLVFFPFAFSGICTGELCSLRDDFSAYEQAGAQLVGISCDPTFSLRAWAEQQRYQFPLLSDFWPHGEAARAYGVFDEQAGRAVRGTFLVDKSGVLRWSVVNPAGEARDAEQYKAALAAL